LYLIFGTDINSRGEIALSAFDQGSGEFHAAMAIPCNEDHAFDKIVMMSLYERPLNPPRFFSLKLLASGSGNGSGSHVSGT
jgi:hypothetical protein